MFSGSLLLTFAPYAASAGGWLLSFYFVWLVYTGRLIPRNIYNERKQAVDKWQAAFDEQREMNHLVLMPMADLLAKILRALPHVKKDDEGKT